MTWSEFPEKSPTQMNKSLSHLLVGLQRAWRPLVRVTGVTWPGTPAGKMRKGVPLPTTLRPDLRSSCDRAFPSSSQVCRSLFLQEVKTGLPAGRAQGTRPQGLGCSSSRLAPGSPATDNYLRRNWRLRLARAWRQKEEQSRLRTAGRWRRIWSCEHGEYGNWK